MICNDLVFLEKQGIVVCVYGGVLICDSMMLLVELLVEDKSVLNIVMKCSVVKVVVELIQLGYWVIFDFGIIIFEIVCLMCKYIDVIVMINGMNVVNVLLEVEGVELLMIGGYLCCQL